ncbi:hypothetical protein AZH53_04120 [Methanomicrobiaceae archaeon CYW5]|uniref:hypothetical protein n=1 Tax=Methanovulcanius yangii TaxID=1789227 RepID=UPI0029CA2C27|nr:hypothetical protein [Methanovulcanius yangii]MBT8507605.1 hypothetical protein [Methanovulcanius yangii]
MNKKPWIILLLLAIMGIMAVFIGVGQGYPVPDSSAAESPGFDDSPPPATVPTPEFPTIAVPAGFLVGMVYIIFLLKDKGRKILVFSKK